MSLKEQLAEAKSALMALKERIENNDAEAIAEGEKLQAEIEAKTADATRWTAAANAATTSSCSTKTCRASRG